MSFQDLINNAMLSRGGKFTEDDHRQHPVSRIDVPEDIVHMVLFSILICIPPFLALKP